MVTLSAILMALFETVMLLSYVFGIIFGWMIVFALVLVIPLWIMDSFRGAHYLKGITNFCLSFFRQETEEKACAICSPNNREALPAEHTFCYACGRHLPVLAKAAEEC